MKKKKRTKTLKRKNKKQHAYIFVYGTLREGGKNYNKISNEPTLKRIGKGITIDKYSFIGAVSGAFPYASNAVFDGIDKTNVIGELYKVLDNNYFSELDKLEYNYNRQIVPVIVEGKRYETNIYLLTSSELIEGIAPNIYPHGRKRFYAIKNGDWLDEK